MQKQGIADPNVLRIQDQPPVIDPTNNSAEGVARIQARLADPRVQAQTMLGNMAQELRQS
jgi:hypothetical protein